MFYLEVGNVGFKVNLSEKSSKRELHHDAMW